VEMGRPEFSPREKWAEKKIGEEKGKEM